MDVKLYADCGCEFANTPDFKCDFDCPLFDNCNARKIVAELERPFPKDGPYVPKTKKQRGLTNAELAERYGVTKRQVAKARSEARSSGKNIQTILRSTK